VRQTVYIDVLIAVNLFINYFLLLGVAGFLSLRFRRLRLFLASLLGASYSLSILLPEISMPVSFLVKLAMAATIVLAAYPFNGLKQFFRELAAFYVMSFSFAGLMLALWYFIAPQGLIIKNSVVYFNISPLFLIVLTVVCYFVIRLINRVTGRQAPEGSFCTVKVEYNGKSAYFFGKVDTGNSLTEPFSNYPVMVVRRELIQSLIPPEESGKIRLVPFHTVSGEGLLPAFRPDSLTLVCGKHTYSIRNVYIAASKTRLGEFDALINPDLLQKTSA
jgi:stage II sporulation protein GA (sporulation sigma-E factor processing peptidase)